MSRTDKARTEAYDNIATGGGAAVITTRERVIKGATAPDFTTVGNTENVSVGNDYGAEKVIKKTTTLLAGENV